MTRIISYKLKLYKTKEKEDGIYKGALIDYVVKNPNYQIKKDFSYRDKEKIDFDNPVIIENSGFEFEVACIESLYYCQEIWVILHHPELPESEKVAVRIYNYIFQKLLKNSGRNIINGKIPGKYRLYMNGADISDVIPEKLETPEDKLSMEIGKALSVNGKTTKYKQGYSYLNPENEPILCLGLFKNIIAGYYGYDSFWSTSSKRMSNRTLLMGYTEASPYYYSINDPYYKPAKLMDSCYLFIKNYNEGIGLKDIIDQFVLTMTVPKTNYGEIDLYIISESQKRPLTEFKKVVDPDPGIDYNEFFKNSLSQRLDKSNKKSEFYGRYIDFCSDKITDPIEQDDIKEAIKKAVRLMSERCGITDVPSEIAQDDNEPDYDKIIFPWVKIAKTGLYGKFSI